MVTAVSRILGIFSAGLGLAQLVAPERLLSFIGIAPRTVSATVMRAVGGRELMVVPGLMAGSRPVGWLIARVAGDLMDLALLALASRDGRNARGRVRMAMAVVGGVLAADVLAAVAARRAEQRKARHADRIVRSVTVGREPEELYRFWRDLENLPRVMPHLEAVEARGGSTSHWVARAPMGQTVEWDAEIVEDRPNELVSWRSVEGADVQNSGTVRFRRAPGDQGTEVTVEMEYEPPGGVVGSVVAMFSGEEPRHQVADALRRFKQVMETGEPVVSEAIAHGHEVMQRPAQPLGDEEKES